MLFRSADTYKKFCIRSTEVCVQNEKQSKLIIKLEAEKRANLETISHLEGEVQLLNSQLNQMTKSVKMLTNGIDKLEEILQIGQNVGNKSGLGFMEAKKSGTGKQMSKRMSQHNSQHQEQRHMKKRYQRWKCHHCGRYGHIKPFCFRLHG